MEHPGKIIYLKYCSNYNKLDERSMNYKTMTHGRWPNQIRGKKMNQNLRKKKEKRRDAIFHIFFHFDKDVDEIPVIYFKGLNVGN